MVDSKRSTKQPNMQRTEMQGKLNTKMFYHLFQSQLHFTLLKLFAQLCLGQYSPGVRLWASENT